MPYVLELQSRNFKSIAIIIYVLDQSPCMPCILLNIRDFGAISEWIELYQVIGLCS